MPTRTTFAEDLCLGHGSISPTQHEIGIHTFLGSSVLSAEDFEGADEGWKISSAITELPDIGGVVYSCAGTCQIENDVFQPVTKPLKLVFLPGRHRIMADVTIPMSVTLEFQPGAILVIDRGKTLTIKGNIIAGFYQIFDLWGKSVGGNSSLPFGMVTFGHDALNVNDHPQLPLVAGRLHREVYPQWWGANGDGKNDDQPAIQAAIQSLSDEGQQPGTGGTVFLPLGVYLLQSGELTISSCGITLRGEGGGVGATYNRNSSLVCTPGHDAIHILATKDGDVSDIGLYDLFIRGDDLDPAITTRGRSAFSFKPSLIAA